MLYTSDGRDIEMSVASTKAFYAQVAAGALLACAITEAAGIGSDRRRHELLGSLRAAARRDASACSPSARRSPRRPGGSRRPSATGRSSATASTTWPPRRCGSSSASSATSRSPADVTEDKKHIDLSSEPLILVCAAGLRGSTADDVAQGDGDLPGPQGDADRDRRRRRGALQRGGDDHGAARSIRRSGSCCRRWWATSSATKRRWRSTRRPGRCARHARSSSAPCRRERPAATRSWPRCVPAIAAHVAAVRTTVCATSCTTAISRRSPRCA